MKNDISKTVQQFGCRRISRCVVVDLQHFCKQTIKSFSSEPSFSDQLTVAITKTRCAAARSSMVENRPSRSLAPSEIAGTTPGKATASPPPPANHRGEIDPRGERAFDDRP
jgi:hypothetical protein